ncbi:MAG: hypothetical protein Q7J54_03800 [Candidatus Woesearchaeota archaeon]|nr:hypothetical protein [Candidatus Woesearchaeota archaeon]
MFNFFRKKEDNSIKEAVKNSFLSVKRDVVNVWAWVRHLNEKGNAHDLEINDLRSSITQQKVEQGKIIDAYYGLHNNQKALIDKIRELDEKIASLEVRKEVAHSGYKQSFKEKVVKKLTKNSKDYVKSVIVSLIQKYEKVSALQLREIVVDEQKLCSKSSFYRILEEVERGREIGFMKDGKEKLYLSKISVKA